MILISYTWVSNTICCCRTSSHVQQKFRCWIQLHPKQALFTTKTSVLCYPWPFIRIQSRDHLVYLDQFHVTNIRSLGSDYLLTAATTQVTQKYRTCNSWKHCAVLCDYVWSKVSIYLIVYQQYENSSNIYTEIMTVVYAWLSNHNATSNDI